MVPRVVPKVVPTGGTVRFQEINSDNHNVNIGNVDEQRFDGGFKPLDYLTIRYDNTVCVVFHRDVNQVVKGYCLHNKDHQRLFMGLVLADGVHDFRFTRQRTPPDVKMMCLQMSN